MDDFDDGEVGLPDEMNTELPDLDTAVESEVEIDLEGVAVERRGRSSGGARAQVASARKSSGGARKSAARPAKKAAKKAVKKAAKKAKPARKAAAKKKAKPAKKAAKKRKAGRKK